MASIESTQAHVAESGDVLVPIEARALLGLLRQPVQAS